jgi:thymidylate kinase
LAIAAAEPARVTVIDATQDVDAVSAQVWAMVEKRFKLSASV